MSLLACVRSNSFGDSAAVEVRRSGTLVVQVELPSNQDFELAFDLLIRPERDGWVQMSCFDGGEEVARWVSDEDNTSGFQCYRAFEDVSTATWEASWEIVRWPGTSYQRPKLQGPWLQLAKPVPVDEVSLTWELETP